MPARSTRPPRCERRARGSMRAVSAIFELTRQRTGEYPRPQEDTQMMRRIMLAILAFLSVSPVDAAFISVSPGPGTPVQDAINAAVPGDTILLAQGGYPE